MAQKIAILDDEMGFPCHRLAVPEILNAAGAKDTSGFERAPTRWEYLHVAVRAPLGMGLDRIYSDG